MVHVAGAVGAAAAAAKAGTADAAVDASATAATPTTAAAAAARHSCPFPTATTAAGRDQPGRTYLQSLWLIIITIS